jgi:hypothetical protein
VTSKIPPWVSITAGVFVGGAQGYFTTQMGNGTPSTGKQWLAMLLGAGLMGLFTVYHYYLDPPKKDPPKTPPSEIKITEMPAA